MKNKYIFLSLMCLTFGLYKLSLDADDNSVKSPAIQILNQSVDNLANEGPDPDTFGYQGESNNNMQGVKPIPFTPADLSTADTSRPYNQQNSIAYYWDCKDDDTTLRFPGKARIGNDQYINVTLVDPKNVDESEDDDAITSTSSSNIMDPSEQNSTKFKPDSLIKLGTCIKQNDPIVYLVYGQYLSTVIPDPKKIEYVSNPVQIPDNVEVV